MDIVFPAISNFQIAVFVIQLPAWTSNYIYKDKYLSVNHTTKDFVHIIVLKDTTKINRTAKE